MAGLKGINEGYIKFFKWLQIDGRSPLGINFGRRKGIFVCLLVWLSAKIILASAAF